MPSLRRRFAFVRPLHAGLLAALGLIAATGCAPSSMHAARELGSTRHARIAIDTDGGRTPVTYFARSLEPEARDRLAVEAPNLRVIAGLTRDQVLARAAEADGIDGSYCSEPLLRVATRLRWVQSPSAGVERYVKLDGLRNSHDIVLTNMQGVHGPTIADHAFAMLLSLTRDLPHYTHPTTAGTWDRRGSGRTHIALQDRTLLVVGLGGIGREVARRGSGFGMRVLATRRSRATPPPFVDEQGTPDQLDAFLARADVVVICVPLTPETQGMIGARELALLPAGAYVINIARGRVVDTDALVAALDRGHLAGAGLDVTDPEPLPPDHPLWGRPNVVITPHVAGRSALTGDRRTALAIENLRRFAAGAPLLNVVDMTAGY